MPGHDQLVWSYDGPGRPGLPASAAIVESSDDAIVSKDLNGVVRSWNRAAERMFSYTADEIVGESIRKIIPADRQHEEERAFSRRFDPASASITSRPSEAGIC
jgi:PAS domain S-box-containing protein